MGFFGLFGGDKKKVLPKGKVLPISDDSENNPWQQSLQQAKDTRGTFWNNIKSGPVGQSWNKKSTPTKAIEHARIKRRKRI